MCRKSVVESLYDGKKASRNLWSTDESRCDQGIRAAGSVAYKRDLS